MLSTISWVDYGKVIAISTVIYYLYVALRYYPEELKGLLINRQNPIPAPLVMDQEPVPASVPSSETAIPPLNPQAQHYLHAVTLLISALKTVLLEASIHSASPSELRQSMQGVLVQHAQVLDARFRSGVLELILAECVRFEKNQLTKQDLEQLWENACQLLVEDTCTAPIEVCLI